ncbi:hypothetical protein CPB97_003450 [Podila verticillata]|nr:hypothetical protein CPB97_003450 [Podila verticillata]
MDPITGGLGPGARKPMRSLQPRAAAALDFNDDSDDDDGGLLSADYKAQRRTTQDLVDFFKNAPPPPQPTLPPIVEEDKKKRTLLQRLRSKKSNPSINGSIGGSGSIGGNGTTNRSSVLMPPSGNGSNISTSTTLTNKNKNGKDEPTIGTLPNGKKYIMIAVDYKGKDGAEGSSESGSALASGASSLNNASRRGPSSIGTGSSSRRQSRALDDDTAAKRMSILSNHITTTTTTTVYDGTNGTEKRRSILPQPTVPSTESSMFGLDSMLGNFAIDTDFMSSSSKPVGAGSADGTNGTSIARQNSKSSRSGPNSADSNGPGGEDLFRTGSKRGNKVTFNITAGAPLDEAAVDEALSQRLAAHKAQQQANSVTSTSAPGSNPSPRTLEDFPEITLPKPVSRKKVRHVQIQTQHCIMRPMYTQTEAMDTLVHDLEVKEWGTQTSDNASEAGTTNSTVVETSTSMSVGTTTKTARPNSKVASLVASLSQPTATTTATTTTLAPAMTSRGQSTGSTQTTTTSTAQTTDKESDLSNATHAELLQEVLQLRQQNTQMHSQVMNLERDLASEIRARTRTAVAMQDTRDKFEMLSAMAYKKLKEMIFQRHVLEMEIRELRAQVDLQGEDVYLHQRNAVAVGQN